MDFIKHFDDRFCIFLWTTYFFFVFQNTAQNGLHFENLVYYHAFSVKSKFSKLLHGLHDDNYDRGILETK